MHMTASETKRSVCALCRRFDISRAAFYKDAKARSRKEVNEALVLALVRQEREVNPRAGTKKVLAAIRPKLQKAGIDIGRNRLGELPKRNGLLVEPGKVFHCRTTKQDPSLVPSPNLVKDMTIDRPDMALCSDITYIYTEEGFIYLSLMMDMFVKDIAGWAMSETLETEAGPLEALKMASKAIGPSKEVVAHSDRGCQYGSRKYLEVLAALGWLSSRTEELHCYENAMAERLNGILKGEYYLDCCFRTKAEAIAAVKRVIEIYNTRRLHEKLGYKTPATYREAMTKARKCTDLMERAKIVMRIDCTRANGIPLGGDINPKDNKFMLLDTGLYLYEAGLNLADWINDAPAKFVNRGKLAEMFVAHELKKSGSPLDDNPLYYWHRENKNGKAEVDFVVQHRNAPLPIEVKSGTKGSMKSLRILMNEKSFKLGVRTSEENLGTLDVGQIRIIPLYLISEYESILRT